MPISGQGCCQAEVHEAAGGNGERADSSTCFGMYRRESITTQSVRGAGPELLIGGQDNENGSAAFVRVLLDGAIDTGFGHNGLADAGFEGSAATITTQPYAGPASGA